MGLFYYQRPREKIQNHGAKGLSMVELLQVLIGSGTAGASSARIAQQLQVALGATNSTEITLQQLLAIQGIGNAKACVMLAALELGRRYATKEPANP